MRLNDYLDKGASLGIDEPCLTMAENTLSYGQVQALSFTIARALRRSGVAVGEKVAILSANDPIAFSCVFGITRASAVWCPINPRNEAAENRDLLAAFDCTCLIYQSGFAALVDQIVPDLTQLTTVVCLDEERPGVTIVRPVDRRTGVRGRVGRCQVGRCQVGRGMGRRGVGGRGRR